MKPRPWIATFTIWLGMITSGTRGTDLMIAGDNVPDEIAPFLRREVASHARAGLVDHTALNDGMILDDEFVRSRPKRREDHRLRIRRILERYGVPIFEHDLISKRVAMPHGV